MASAGSEKSARLLLCLSFDTPLLDPRDQILAWNKRVFVSGAAAETGEGAVLGTRNNALLAGMVYVRISGLAKSRRLTLRNKEETLRGGCLVEREFPQYR